MTKKIFAMFLAVLMVVSMLPTSVFAASCPGKGNEHTKSNCDFTEVGKTAPNCGNKGYTTYKCNTCNDTFVADFVNPVGEHTWVDAKDEPETCEKDGWTGGKECSVCHEKVGATKVDKIPNGLKCEWTEWAPADVDCTTGGKQTATCKHCGDVKEQEVPKAEGGRHVMGDWELKTPATAEANGLAVQKCQNPKCGYTVEQAVLFDHDHDANTLSFVAQVAAKCEETGVKAHYECRICGNLFKLDNGVFKPTTLADLTIKTAHDTLKDGLTCTSTNAECSVCKEIVSVSAADAHQYNDWVVEVAPGCLTDGFEKRTCKKCANTETQIIKPLGHDLQTVEVASTCVSYAYTYTYCTRANCTKFVEVKLPEEHNAAKYEMVEHKLQAAAIAENTGFYLALYQNSKYVNLPLYFTGAMDGNYLATSSDYRNAVKVFVEVVDGGYRLFFKEGETKTYIEIYEWDTVNHKVGVHLTAEPKNVFTWNDVAGVLTTSINGTEYYLGTYNKYTTISASKISYITGNNAANVGVTQFPAMLSVVDSFEAAKVVSYSIDKTAGVNTTDAGHAWKNLTNLTASCMNDVVNSFLCEDCGAVKTVKIDKLADHNWNKGEVTKEATCTEKGEKLYTCQCKGCNVTKKEEIAAKNHSNLVKENDQVKVFTEPGDHTSPISYKYNLCECGEKVNKHDYKAWANAGKLWDTKEAAEVEHDLEKNATITVNGSCTVVGYNGYKCSGCSEIVRVKIDHTGAHYAGDGVVAYKAPTCTEDGFSLNFKCVNCGKLVDETKAEGYVENIPALGHTWKTFTAKEREDLGLGEYKKAPCGSPVYNNWIGYCSVCHPNGLTTLEDAALQADTELVEQKILTGALCTAEVYELYKCHCGETHMRGYLVAGKNVNHEYIVDATATKKEATHFEEGHIDMVCKYCGAEAPEAMEIIAKLPHKNAAKEEFTDHCNDSVTDRHCVLCCAVKCVDKDNKKHDCAADQKADEEGVQDCDCIIGKHHDWSEKTYVGSICGDAPYYSEICAYCYETKAVDAEEYWTGKYTDKEETKKEMAPIFGLGHKPVAADADKYGQYTYVKIVHPEYVWVDGVVVMTEASKVAYEAKYIEYKAATFTTDGFAKFVCADCGKTIEAVLPATAGLGFELKVENANGKDGISEGTLVNVTLYANGNNVEVNNFTLNANFGGMIFVGAQPANDSFAIHVTKPENADGFLKIAANAVNTADKKQQNIVIGENTPIVTMQFIAWGAGKTNVQMNGQAFALNNVKVNCAPKACEIEIKTLLDFNEDTFFLMSDLVQAEAILTGESEKTYDVTVDVDKDGEVTLYDLNLMFEYYVNQFVAGAREELVLNGLSEEHVAIVRQHLNKAEESTKHECIGKYCSYTADEKFDVCPVCKTVQ